MFVLRSVVQLKGRSVASRTRYIVKSLSGCPLLSVCLAIESLIRSNLRTVQPVSVLALAMHEQMKSDKYHSLTLVDANAAIWWYGSRTMRHATQAEAVWHRVDLLSIVLRQYADRSIEHFVCMQRHCSVRECVIESLPGPATAADSCYDLPLAA